jgi:S-adenosylmethionine:tRNA-ribosyltransferase-isomerase (queuine synthetase)
MNETGNGTTTATDVTTTEGLAVTTVTVKDTGTTTTTTKKRGRPMLSVGTTVTRKNGTFTKGEDGKWHKTA